MFCDQQQRFHRGLPFVGIVFGLGQFGDVRGGVTERDHWFRPGTAIGSKKPLIARHEFAFAPNWWRNEEYGTGSKHF